jgi:carbon-monoxide dehydrogenase small subunit
LGIAINGQPVERTVEARTTLLDYVRGAELTGTHAGCEMGACGACLLLVDDMPVHACLMLAAQAEGRKVETIEGLSERGAIADLQQAFLQRNALQCGYCTPGMMATAYDILKRPGVPSRAEVRDALSGNYCRCTGYEAIVDAIVATAAARQGAKS